MSDKNSFDSNRVLKPEWKKRFPVLVFGLENTRIALKTSRSSAYSNAIIQRHLIDHKLAQCTYVHRKR